VLSGIVDQVTPLCRKQPNIFSLPRIPLPFQNLLLHFRMLHLLMPKPMEFFSKILTMPIILRFVVMPSLLHIEFVRIGPLHEKMKLVYFVQLMRIQRWICYLDWQNQIVSVIVVCRIPVMSHHLLPLRCQSLVFFKHTPPQFRILTV
jgi:hypothetical protein